jgi:ABC-2 type transport system ATP-binding protein
VDYAIRTRGLRKRYGNRKVVLGVDLDVPVGEVFALLGPNGAGKTTTVEMLEGHRRRTSGQIDVLGFDPWTGGRAFREQIGVVLQSAGLNLDLTVEETLEFYGGYFPDARNLNEVLDLVGLMAQRLMRIGRLSSGQSRRLDLAIAIIGRPRLVFLDEPTAGFDPQLRSFAWDVIAGLRDAGATVLLTTHYMEEAYRLADRIAIMRHGKIVAGGTPSELIALSERQSVIKFRLPEDATLDDLPQSVRAAMRVELGEGRMIELATDKPEWLLYECTSWAVGESHQLDGLSVGRPTLEDVFLQITNDRMAGHGVDTTG